MRVITVEQDNDGALSKAVKKAYPNDEIVSFTDPMLAIKFCISSDIQKVICEQTLKRMDGLSFIKLIHQKHSDIRAVLVCKNGDSVEDTDGINLCRINYPVTVEKLRE